MILLTPDLRHALRANAISSLAAQAQDMRFDPVPVVKFFNPLPKFSNDAIRYSSSGWSKASSIPGSGWKLSVSPMTCMSA